MFFKKASVKTEKSCQMSVGRQICETMSFVACIFGPIFRSNPLFRPQRERVKIINTVRTVVFENDNLSRKMMKWPPETSTKRTRKIIQTTRTVVLTRNTHKLMFRCLISHCSVSKFARKNPQEETKTKKSPFKPRC